MKRIIPASEPGIIEEIMRSMNLRSSVGGLIKQGRKWDAYRTLYNNLMPEIMGRNGNHYGIDPYLIDWTTHFTPIESDAWHTIRCLGLPLYPQFPVKNVFVDFGDPVKRIALECDGKYFHDEEKDFLRDSELFKAGWVVFRVTGSECRKPDIDFEKMVEDLDFGWIIEGDFKRKVADWVMNTSDGLITAIGAEFYNKKPYRLDHSFFNASLNAHSSFFWKGH